MVQNVDPRSISRSRAQNLEDHTRFGAAPSTTGSLARTEELHAQATDTVNLQGGSSATGPGVPSSLGPPQPSLAPSAQGISPVTFGALEGMALDTMTAVHEAVASPVKATTPIALREASPLATTANEAALAPSPAADQVFIRSKTEARTGYFDYSLRDGKIWMKWNPILPPGPFTIPSGEVLTDEQAHKLLSDVPGPYTYAYDRPHNEIVVTPKPDAGHNAFTLVNGRLAATDPAEATRWHLHNGDGGPSLPPGEHVVEMQVAGEFIQVRTNTNKMYSYDPTKKEPVEWKAQSGCPFGGDVHLPQDIRDWTFGQSVSIKPWRECINAINPYTDIVSYYEDAKGRKGAIGFTATTGVLMGNGREVRYRDTGLPADFMRGFLTPHRGRFLGEKLAQAGSTWLVFGHEPDGTPAMYARMYDYEINGDCPIKRYTYDDLPFEKDTVHSLDDMVQRLPLPGWNPIPFPTLSGQATVTDRLDIVTTGSGDLEREIRIEGRNAEGVTGFYHKKVDSDAWQFTATRQPLAGTPVAVGRPDPAKASPAPVSWSYDRATWSGVLAKAPLRNLELLDFHPYQTQDEPSTVRFTLESGKVVDALVRTGDGYSMFQGREADTELVGAGVGLQKVLTGTLDLPEALLHNDDPEVKGFVDSYLVPMNHRENALMVLADEDELRVLTSWYHRNSDERFDWTPNPPIDVTFTRDARGETAYEKRALDARLRPADAMCDSELTDVIDRNAWLEKEMTDDLEARKTHHKLRWVRSEIASAGLTAASWAMSALNLTRTVDLLATVSEIAPPLMAAHAKADWHTAWTTPAGYERAMATLHENVTRAEAILERRRLAP